MKPFTRLAAISLLGLGAFGVSAESKPLFTPYGFVLTSYDFANAGVASFGSTNLVAPTAAAARAAPSDSLARSSFHAAQSRLGTLIRPSEVLTAKFEIDFADFNKASTTTGSMPRLRLAKIDYAADAENTFFFGQDWDLFSPLHPHTYNLVGSSFQAGNSGFVRQQFGWLRKTAASETGVSLGLPGTNNAASDGNLEISRVPTVSARWSWIGEGSRSGLSAVATRLLLGSPGSVSQTAYGVALHHESTLGALNLRGEIYAGQGLANIGALTLSQSRADRAMREAGGWLSAKWGFSPGQSLYAGIGFASVIDRAQVAAPSPTTTGLKGNRNLRLGYDRKIAELLNTYVEYNHYQSAWQVMGTANASTFGTGFQLPF